ncbi:MAG TPA: Dabb family protein [Coriobacteriia bacterium]|nr:Dabb family protein [Coriobacteriia bacterium]
MIKHIVFWKLADTALNNTAEENAREIKCQLEALAGQIDGLLHIEVGIDFSRTDASADVALYSEFADRESLDAYLIHPLHLAAAAFIGQVRSDRVVVDYEL